VSQFAALASILKQQTGAAPPAWAPTDISGCVLWLDASDAATITDAGSGAVSAWADKSASGWNVTQATSAARPTTGTTTINGRNALTFDGGDVLAMSGSSLANANVTTFAVFRENSAVNFSGVITFNTGTSNDNTTGITMTAASGVNVLGADRVGAFAAVAGTNPTPLGVYAVRYGTAASGLVTAYRGTGTSGTTTTPTTGTTTGIVVGGRYQSGAVSASFRLNGAIAEIVVYSSTLSASDTNLVGNYLADKWAQTWTNIA
jgi:hypothetical protein